jgi:cytoskeletal protein CcmA (bactofilin family)
MGLQDFRKGREGETAPLMSSGGGMGALTAFIDQGSEFVGKLSFKDTVRIDGRFEGEISSENTLIVGETGEIHANIVSETVVISGTVEGDVTARRSVTLHKTARVNGNVETVSLVVEEGAEMHGHIKMGKAKPKGGGDTANKPAQEKVVPMHDKQGGS